MKKTNIIKLKIPESWDDINGVLLKKIFNVEEKNAVETVKKYFNILFGLDEKTINKIDTNTINQLVTDISFIFSKKIEKKEFKKINILGKEYGLFDSKFMTVNDWVDGLNYNTVEEFIENLEIFLPTIIREIDFEYDNTFILKRLNEDKALIIGKILIEKLKTTEIIYILEYYINTRKEFIEKYKNFFNSGNDGEEISWFHKKWGWYNLIYQVAESHIYGTVKDVENMRLTEFINFIIYKTDSAKYDELKMKQRQQLDAIKQKSKGRA